VIKEFSGDFLQWLRGFYYVATTGSVSVAAVQMLRNQPAISHQVKSLEEELGVTLFDRSKGKMLLTQEGEELLEHTISIFEIIKEIRAEIGRTDRDICGPISIATTRAINTYYLPGYIIPFQQQNPGVYFDIKGGTLKNILENVDASSADFGIGSLVSIPESFHYEELFKTRLVLIAPKLDIFEIGIEVTIETLRSLPLLAPPDTSTISILMKELSKKENFEWNVVQKLDSFSLVKRYVQLGMGVSVIDEYAVLEDIDRLNVYPLDAFFSPRSYGILLRNRKYLSPQVRKFIKTLKDKAPDFDLDASRMA
jgi:DNA-binding transcriptional LysR family regulator